MRQNRLHILRRMSQIAFIAVVILVPVLDIFRFDSASGNLIVLGSQWNLGLNPEVLLHPSFQNSSHVAWQVFLKALLPWIIVLSVFPLLGAVLGRFFCGWFCPEGALFELFDFLTMKIFGRRSLFTKKGNDPDGPAEHRMPYVVLALFCMIAIPLLSGAVLTGYFIAPRTVWSQIAAWEFTFGVKAGIIGVSLYLFLSSMVIRHTLCKYICGAGLMQTLFGWASPISLRVGPDLSRMTYCTDCRKCEKACFMDVKPRTPRRNINCVNCGECITACKNELGTDRRIFSFVKNRDCCVVQPGEAERPLDDALNMLQKTAAGRIIRAE